MVTKNFKKIVMLIDQQGSFPPAPSPLMTAAQGPRKSRLPPPPPTSAPPPPPPPKPHTAPPPPLSPPPPVPGAVTGGKIPPPPPVPPQLNMDFTRPVSLGRKSNAKFQACI